RSLTLFNLYGYADLSDLRSFPTRRSSDLLPKTLACTDFVPITRNWPSPDRSRSKTEPGVSTVAIGTGPTSRSNSRASAWSLFCVDRKSTRLNSSHVKTSYAVLCLRKNQQQ